MRSANEKSHYRARFTLYPYKSEGDTFSLVFGTMLDWIREKEERIWHTELLDALVSEGVDSRLKCGSFSFPSSYRGGAVDEPMGTCLATSALYGDEDRLNAWAIEYDEPDSGTESRRWHTSVGVLLRDDGTCLVNIAVTYYTFPGYLGEPFVEPRPNIPRFVATILSDEKYWADFGNTRAWYGVDRLTCETFWSHFANDIRDPERQIPMILAVTGDDGSFPVADMDEFARNLLGLANVYLLDRSDLDLRHEMFKLIQYGKPSYAFRTAPRCLRIYLPGADLDNEEDSLRHRFFKTDEILALGDRLIDVVNRRLVWSDVRTDEDIVDISDIDIRQSRRDFSELSERFAELHAAAEDRRARAALLPERETDKDRENERLKEENDQLWEELEQSEKAIEGLNDQYNQLHDQLAANKNEIDRLQRETRRQIALNQDYEGADAYSLAVEKLFRFPEDLYEVLAFAHDLWPRRLFVLDEAWKSAKEYGRRGKRDEQWRILKSLALDLWQLRFEGTNRTNLEGEFKRRAGFSLALRESGSTNKDPKFAAQRKRKYQGRMIDITPHVKGKDGKPSQVFRVYFAFDEARRLIVIGHCGGHLDTAGTRRRGK